MDLRPNPYATAILAAMQGRPIYQGTVPAADTKRRRAANKVARASRRTNRKRGA